MLTQMLHTDAGARFSRAWLAVFGAASTDKEEFALFRTVHVEVFGRGVRLSATDAYWSATAWVGAPIDPAEPDLYGSHREPRASAPPLASVAVFDPDRRIYGLMQYVVAQTKKVDATNPDVPVTISVTDDDDEMPPGTLPGTERTVVRVDIPGAEHVTGYVNEIEYPNLSRLVRDQHTDRGPINDITLAPRILKSIGAALERAGAITLKFSGSANKAVRWDALDIDTCELYGLAMPCRTLDDDSDDE